VSAGIGLSEYHRSLGQSAYIVKIIDLLGAD